MNTIQSLLAELEVKNGFIVNEYISYFRKQADKISDEDAEFFFNTAIKKFRGAIAGAATDIVHKSISEGYEDKNDESHLQLIMGIERINSEAAKKFMEGILLKNLN